MIGESFRQIFFLSRLCGFGGWEGRWEWVYGWGFVMKDLVGADEQMRNW